ncbi:MAG: DUF6069 family protein [Caldilinea sp.]|nr:hypothetical protein [Caldilineaceae bacterium]MCO5212117.1 DUF6069 family protein [Caldilinea sp.]MCB9117485.1 hypothetical protein [Caldilineaceae bacterium]MCB9118101.1 hypothetical protein [Caldilineaceae bacterium]MCB9123272.1 hypothetical protein [Caldilineaceae bacterium]
MTTTIEPTGTHATGVKLSRLLWVSPLAMLAAAAANLALYFVAGRIAPEVTAWPGSGPTQVVGATVVYLLVGTLVCAVIGRLASRPARPFVIVASIGLLLSLALPISVAFGYGPPGTSPASLATAIALCLMHVVAYAIFVPLFVRLVLNGEEEG